MIGLSTLLYTMIEPNSSVEALTSFKQRLQGELGVLAERLSRILPFKTADAAVEFMVVQVSLAGGMYPMLNLTPKQEEAMDIVGMISDPDYYREMLCGSTESLLRGLTDTER
jgi:hypothetical protein